MFTRRGMEKIGLEARAANRWNMSIVMGSDRKKFFRDKKVISGKKVPPIVVVNQELITRRDILKKFLLKSIEALKSWVKKQQKTVTSKGLTWVDSPLKRLKDGQWGCQVLLTRKSRLTWNYKNKVLVLFGVGGLLKVTLKLAEMNQWLMFLSIKKHS